MSASVPAFSAKTLAAKSLVAHTCRPRGTTKIGGFEYKVRRRAAQRGRRLRCGYPNSATDNTNSTRSTCREMDRFW